MQRPRPVIYKLLPVIGIAFIVLGLVFVKMEEIQKKLKALAEIDFLAEKEDSAIPVKPNRPNKPRFQRSDIGFIQNVVSKEAKEQEKRLLEQSYEYQRYLKSQQVISGFKAESGLWINAPGDVLFSTVDLGDETSVVHGKSPSSQLEMTIVAGPGRVEASEVLPFLKESAPDLPGFERRWLKGVKRPEEFSLRKKSGLEGGNLWSVKINAKEDLYITLNQRVDGKASYLIMTKGPHQYLDNNESAFEKMYDDMKAERLND